MPTGTASPANLFDDVPGPSPWYLIPESRVAEGFRWVSAGKGPNSSGKTLLIGQRGPVAILGFENYVKALGPSTLLIWQQGRGRNIVSAPVHFQIVVPSLLQPLDEDLETHYRAMNSGGRSILLGGPPSVEFDLGTTDIDGESTLEFPDQLHALDELLLFCKSSAIGVADGWSKANIALIVANPKASTYRLYPQDWFNEGSFDFGYQWLTRVVRDPVTRQVYGEGIRIGSFILDDSLRNLRKR